MSRDRDSNTDINSDVIKPLRPRRIEVINGVERRRSWPDEVKFAIMAEALEPGAIISHVARRHDMSPSQLFGWLKKLRGVGAAPTNEALTQCEVPRFVPAVLEAACEPCPEQQPAPGSMEITVGRARIVIRGAVDERVLASVLNALKVRP
jgi:transposase